MSESIVYNYLPLSRYQSEKANIRRPREIAYFSYDDQHKFLPLSEASLRYYSPPFYGAPGEAYQDRYDLGAGFENFIKHDDSIDEHLDALLKTIEAAEIKKGERFESDFITWRGMMTKILTAPYDKFDGFEMNATLYQDTIFIEENHASKRKDAPQKQMQRSPNKPSPAEMQYWGYKFETLSTLNKRRVETTREEIENRGREVVSNEAQYCSIVRTGIDDFNIIIAGEVDAVLGEKPEDPEYPIPWVELKTSKHIENQNDSRKYGDKLLKFWAQSFLLGVPTIVVGFRSEYATLLDIKRLETHRIPSIAQDIAKQNGMTTWDGKVCVKFASEILRFLKNNITEPGIVWRIAHRAKSGKISLDRIESIKAATIVTPDFQTHREHMVQNTI